MDRITELYAKAAYDGRTASDVLADLKSAAAVVVLVTGVTLNLALPILIVWALIADVGLR